MHLKQFKSVILWNFIVTLKIYRLNCVKIPCLLFTWLANQCLTYFSYLLLVVRLWHVGFYSKLLSNCKSKQKMSVKWFSVPILWELGEFSSQGFGALVNNFPYCLRVTGMVDNVSFREIPLRTCAGSFHVN